MSTARRNVGRLELAVARTAHHLLHRAAIHVGRASRLCRELALALYSPELEGALARSYSGRTRAYAATAYQNLGLYPYELRALEGFFPNPPARLFLPGAGSGREAKALVELGYVIDALEPSPTLRRAAEHFVNNAHFSIREMTLQEWSFDVRGEYDAIFSGWPVWTHILGCEDRIRILKAFATTCPRGPILLSFWRGEQGGDVFERARGGHEVGRMRRTSEWIRGRLFRLPGLENGTDWNEGLFVHWVTRDELELEARAAGLKVVFYERDAARFSSAVLRRA